MINGPHHLRNALADWVIDEFDAVVVYTERAQRTVYSLRSPKRMDVAAFAERFGGGGHKDSAAFSIKHSKLHTLLLRAPFYKLTLKERLVAGLRLIFKGA
ncbi:DHHA1 domain protein [compost metagenome]